MFAVKREFYKNHFPRLTNYTVSCTIKNKFKYEKISPMIAF